MPNENYVINKAALNFGLKLFEDSMAENNKLGEWLMEKKDIRIKELTNELSLANDYIYYVEMCVRLHVVPRTLKYWLEFIQ